MEIYVIGTFISIVIACLIEVVVGFKTKKTIKMFISILPLTLISAFRYDVGWDYIKIYTNGFFYVGKYNTNWFSEYPFNLLVRILYNVFHDPLSLFIVMSLLTAFMFSKCFSVYGKDNHCFVYVILYVISRYYLASLNIMRQALSMMIVLYALQYLYKKKLNKYVFLIILASCFHMISIIYLPMYFILSRNARKTKNILLFILCVPILLVFIKYGMNLSKYAVYSNSMIGNDGSILYSELLLSLLIMLISAFMYKKIENDDMMIVFFNMEFISCIIAIFSFALPIADRIIWYFTMMNIFYIPLLLDNFKIKNNKLLFSIVIYGCFILVFVMQTYMVDSYSILPYKNIIEVRSEE